MSARNIPEHVKNMPKPDFLTDEEFEWILDNLDKDKMREAGLEQARVYQATNGLEGGELAGAPVLVLTTIGRKTGKKVATALNYLEHGPDRTVVASYAGRPAGA